MKKLPKKIELDSRVEEVQRKITRALEEKSVLPREKFSSRDSLSLGIRPQHLAPEENIQRRVAFVLEKKGDPQTDPNATVLVFTPEGLYRCRYIFTQSAEGGYLPDWQRREECADLLPAHADALLEMIKQYKSRGKKLPSAEDAPVYHLPEPLPAADTPADADTQTE